MPDESQGLEYLTMDSMTYLRMLADWPGPAFPGFAAAFLADADRVCRRSVCGGAAPRRPRLRDEDVSLGLPRPDPHFLPPWSCLFTVAQARRSASPSGTPCAPKPQVTDGRWDPPPVSRQSDSSGSRALQ